MVDFCAYCGSRQKQLTWACPSCAIKYCTHNCMNKDKDDHTIVCSPTSTTQKTFPTKTFYNTTKAAVPASPKKNKEEKKSTQAEGKKVDISKVVGSYKTKACKFYLTGECFQGEKCTFLHAEEQPICKHFVAGHCSYGEECYNLHPEPSPSRNGTRQKSAPSSPTKNKGPLKKAAIPCAFFNQGRCKYGEKCLFLHDPDLVEDEEYEEEEWEEEEVEVERPVCEHYLRGTCSYGSKCWKEHPRDADIICDHYNKGKCEYGSGCWKQHKEQGSPRKERRLEVEVKRVEEEEARPYCDHFQRGVCTYGEKCWKRHEMMPLYKAEFAPKVEDIAAKPSLVEHFNNVKLNSARSTPCTDDDIFISDSDEEEDTKHAAKHAVNKKSKKKAAAPENIFEVLGADTAAPESDEEESDKENEFRENNKAKPNQSTKAEEEKKQENLSNAEKKKLKKEKKKEKEREENLKKIDKLKREGNAHFAEFRYSAAVKSYTSAIGLCGANNPTPAIFNNRAAAHMMLENFGSALRDARRVTQFEPANPKAHHRIVKCCIVLGRTEEGKASLERIQPELDPEHGAMLGSLREAERMEEAAEGMRARGDHVEAARLLGKVLAICSHSPRLRSLQALCYALQRDLTSSSRILNQLDKKDAATKSPTFHYAQGMIHYYSDDMDRAVSNFSECVKEYPEAKDWREKALAMQNALVSGNRAMKMAGGFLQAKKAYDCGLAVDPSNTVYQAKLLYARASLLESYDKTEEALADCSSCIELDSSFQPAWATRGSLKLKKEDFSGAVEDLQEAQRLKPSPDSFSKLEDARRKAEKAGKRKPTHYQVLGVEKTAQIDQIKKAYRAKAKEFHPDKHATAAPEEQARMEAKMKEIAAAHSCLSDSEKRDVYDQKLERMLRRDGTDIDDTSGGWSDDEEEYDFNIDNFFYFMFGMNNQRARGQTFVFRC